MKAANKQWYQIYIVIDDKEIKMGVTQSIREARKHARDLDGHVRKIPCPKTVITR